jgi:hypothetical protein
MLAGIWVMTWVLAILGFLELRRAGLTAWAVATLLVSVFFCPFLGLATYVVGARHARSNQAPHPAELPPPSDAAFS